MITWCQLWESDVKPNSVKWIIDLKMIIDVKLIIDFKSIVDCQDTLWSILLSYTKGSFQKKKSRAESENGTFSLYTPPPPI